MCLTWFTQVQNVGKTANLFLTKCFLHCTHISICFSKEIISPSSFSNFPLHSPPAQPFFTISQEIINLSLSVGLVEGCCFCSFLPGQHFLSSFSSASFISNPTHHLSRYGKQSHISSHLQQQLSTLLPYLVFLWPISEQLHKRSTQMSYQRPYKITHIWAHTCLELLSYSLILDSDFYFRCALPRRANSTLNRAAREVIMISLLCLGRKSECMGEGQRSRK